jgi:hypothetical protein
VDPVLPSRRAVLATSAWAAPVIVLASAAPALAASGDPTSTVTSVTTDYATGVGTALFLLTPAPASKPEFFYDWPGPVMPSTITDLGPSGAGQLYEFRITLGPPPPATWTLGLRPTAVYPGFTITLNYDAPST